MSDELLLQELKKIDAEFERVMQQERRYLMWLAVYSIAMSIVAVISFMVHYG